MGYREAVSLDQVIRGIKKKVAKNIPRAKRVVLTKIAKDSENRIPYKTGNLTASLRVVNDSALEFTADYAEYPIKGVSRSGAPMEYNREYHSEACSYPVEKTFETNFYEYKDMFEKEVLRDV